MIRSVEINGQVMDIQNPEAATLESVKAAAVSYDPRLANATPYLEGDVVKFRIGAGVKGADLTEVHFGDQVMALGGTEANDPKAVRDAVARLYPQYANASWTISGSVITLFVAAGVKG